jgi:hypothetical protein
MDYRREQFARLEALIERIDALRADFEEMITRTDWLIEAHRRERLGLYRPKGVPHDSQSDRSHSP